MENFTRFQKWSGVFSAGNNKFKEEEVYIADSSFFEMFSFHIIEGDPETSLVNPMEMLVSQSTAR